MNNLFKNATILFVGLLTIMGLFMWINNLAKNSKCEASESTIDTSPVNGLRALLFIPQKCWDRKKDLSIYVALQNGSNSTIIVDRRLYLGSSIRLSIKHSKGVIKYNWLSTRVSRPAQDDLVKLKPGEFIGRRLIVTKEGSMNQTRKDIDNMPSGVANLEVEYNALDYAWDWNSGKPPWWTGSVISNEVEIEVK